MRELLLKRCVISGQGSTQSTGPQQRGWTLWYRHSHLQQRCQSTHPFRGLRGAYHLDRTSDRQEYLYRPEVQQEFHYQANAKWDQGRNKIKNWRILRHNLRRDSRFGLSFRHWVWLIHEIFFRHGFPFLSERTENTLTAKYDKGDPTHNSPSDHSGLEPVFSRYFSSWPTTWREWIGVNPSTDLLDDGSFRYPEMHRIAVADCQL